MEPDHALVGGGISNASKRSVDCLSKAGNDSSPVLFCFR
jgi:hypothetical protein